MDQSKLFEDVLSRQADAFANCASFHDRAKEGYRTYYSWEQRAKYGYADNIDPAIGFRKCEALKAYLRCNVLEPGISAVSEEDSANASVMNDIVKADYSNPRVEKEFDDLYHHMIVGGTGILKLGWSFREKFYWRWVRDDNELLGLVLEAANVIISRNPNSETAKRLFAALSSGDVNEIKSLIRSNIIPNIKSEPGNTGFIVQDLSQSDRPKFDVIPAYDFAWIGNSSCVRDCDYVYRRFFVTPQQVQAWERQGGWENLSDVLKTSHKHIGNTLSTSQQLDLECGRPSVSLGVIEFIEETSRDENGVIWETIINVGSGKVVRHRKSPYFHNEIPYFTSRLLGSVSDFAGIPILVASGSAIGAYIKLLNEILENGELSINKVFLTRIGGRQPAPQLKVYGGNLIGVEGYDDVRPLDIPDIRPTSLALLNQMKNEIDEITGCPSMLELAHGDMSGGNAGALEQLQFYQTARFSAIQHQLAVELSALTLQVVKLHQQYDYKGRTVYVNELDGKGGKFVYYEPSQFAGNFEAYSDPRSMLPTNNAVKRSQLLAAFNVLSKVTVADVDEKTGQPVQVMVCNNREFVREIFSTFDMLSNSHLFNKHGDVTSIIPEALPAVPQPSASQQTAAASDISLDSLSPEDREKLSALSEKTGLSIEQILTLAQAFLSQSKDQANEPTEIQGGAFVSPDQAVKMKPSGYDGTASSVQNTPGANGAKTQTGTSGMPPIKGGTQQAGSSFHPNNLSNPKTVGDVVLSSRSIQ